MNVELRGHQKPSTSKAGVSVEGLSSIDTRTLHGLSSLHAQAELDERGEASRSVNTNRWLSACQDALSERRRKEAGEQRTRERKGGRPTRSEFASGHVTRSRRRRPMFVARTSPRAEVLVRRSTVFCQTYCRQKSCISRQNVRGRY